MNWFEDLEPPVQAAIIAGGVALVTAIVAAIGTTLNTWLKDRLERGLAAARRKEEERDTYRRYAEPLTTAASVLYWRLREILETGGGYYLEQGGGATPFESYKVTSTRFRIASLLGWIAALRRELLLSDSTANSSVQALRHAVDRVETALAEGGHIEVDRAKAVCSLLGVDAATVPDLPGLGRAINSAVKRTLHRAGESSARELNQSAAGELFAEVFSLVSTKSGAPCVPAPAGEVEHDIIEALSVREAWIYRDWQDAIGESMLAPAVGSSRCYDVKGYRDFLRMTESPESFDRPWLNRLEDLTSDLDVKANDATDARVKQLDGVYIAVARLVVDFHEQEPARSGISPATLSAVQQTTLSRS